MFFVFCIFKFLGTVNDFEIHNLFWQMNAQKQKGQALNAASAQKAIDILKVLFISFLQF